MTNAAAGLPRTIAVINGKGGVFKSSIVSSVGALLAEAGWRVLLIDLDIQGNQSEDLGLADSTDEGKHQVAVIPAGRPFEPQPTGRERLDIIHGGIELEDLASVMQGRQARDPEWMYALGKSIASIRDDYDLILMDCPPGLPILQTLALVAARYVVIPTRSDAGSRKGMRLVARRFAAARAWNEDLELLGVVRTGITSSAKGIREEVRREIAADLGGAAPVFETCIRYAERPAKAVRDTGRLPHELEPEAERWFKARFERLRERKVKEAATKPGAHRADRTDEAEIVLAPSTTGLAQDYAELAQEFVNLLGDAEGRAEESA
ncbi:ParA family protein [Nocardioides limicola]|uniref:ParA family protein n=1 Tax=Nocardioides limicola TaxID=2803368 RepID=UPI00193BC477|nr:ParA family protein [Nocardioides sp. DJM-14]